MFTFFLSFRQFIYLFFLHFLMFLFMYIDSWTIVYVSMSVGELFGNSTDYIRSVNHAQEYISWGLSAKELKDSKVRVQKAARRCWNSENVTEKGAFWKCQQCTQCLLLYLCISSLTFNSFPSLPIYLWWKHENSSAMYTIYIH